MEPDADSAKKPALVTGGGKLFVVVGKVRETTTPLSAAIHLKKVNKDRTRFDLELSFTALNGRQITKPLHWKFARPITREELTSQCQKRCDAVGRAQARAALVRSG